MRPQRNVLGKMVSEVLQSGQSQTLSPEQLRQFHSDFEADVSEKAESMRAQNRRAYDEVKAIALK